MQQTLTIKEIAQNALDYHEAGLLGAQLSWEELHKHAAPCCYVYNDGKHRCAIGASFNPTLIKACVDSAELNMGLTVSALTGTVNSILDISSPKDAAVLQGAHDTWATKVAHGEPAEACKEAEANFLMLARSLVETN